MSVPTQALGTIGQVLPGQLPQGFPPTLGIEQALGQGTGTSFGMPAYGIQPFGQQSYQQPFGQQSYQPFQAQQIQAQQIQAQQAIAQVAALVLPAVQQAVQQAVAAQVMQQVPQVVAQLTAGYLNQQPGHHQHAGMQGWSQAPWTSTLAARPYPF
jgi:hypothetical protein